MTASAETIASRLLDWYDQHARELPWRSPPGAPPPEPYRVWLSEIMLQQTTVAAVKPYFAAFLERWPSVEELALAEPAEIMAAWAGLGYYSRARNLHACAREVARLGEFPRSEAELRKLPGIGDYTAAAVAAIAFGGQATPVDANVERVVARLFAIDEPLPRGRAAIRRAAGSITPDHRAGDFAQAMMDLGSSVCTPREPHCLSCPIANACKGHAAGDPQRYPVKPAKRAKPGRIGTAWWIERDGQVWLVRRPGKGMLGGMRALPDDGWRAASDGSGEAPLVGAHESLGMVRHGFTHFDLELSVKRIASLESPPGEGEFWSLERLDEAGLPTLFAKAARLVLARR